MLNKIAYRHHLFACALFILPIAIANAYYIDDLGRAVAGYTGWGRDGRPMADVIMIVLNLGKRLTDLAPLPLLIAAALLAWCFYRFQQKFLGDGGVMAMVVSLSFLGNPFFVEVLSYRFDSLTIVGGIAFAFLSVTLGQYGRIRRNALAMLAMVAAIASYQILLNILVILVLIAFICQVARPDSPRAILLAAAERLCQLLVALGGYFWILLPLSLRQQEVANHPGVASANLLATLSDNAHDYSEFIRANLFGDATLPLFTVLTGIMLLGTGYLSYAYLRARGRGLAQWLIVAGCMLSPLIAAFFILGALLFLSNSIAGFSRVYLGLSGYLLYGSTLIYLVAKRLDIHWLNIISVVPLLYIFPFIYAYGNALRQQNILDHDLVLSIKHHTAEYNENEYYVVFNGNRRESAVLRNAAKKYPLISSLVVNYFSNWYFPFRYMQINGLEQRYPQPSLGITDRPTELICTSRLLKKTTDYNLYLHQDIFTVDFAKYTCP